MNETLELLHGKGVITALDRSFAYFLARLAGTDQESLLLGAALVSHATATGDVCLELDRHAGKPLAWPMPETPIYAPSLARWRRDLRYSKVVAKPGEFRPLVLDEQDRLYLYRYWDYERQLADDLIRRSELAPPVDEARLADGLARLFSDRPQGDVDWQKLAAALAVLKNFCVISGAPGTGKTTTLAKILALLLEQAGARGLRIRLAAPTGKAAARMQEAIQASKHQLVTRVAPPVLANLPEHASTLHRLLGATADAVYFQHDQANPLPVDVLVIDEASMVDLPLMTKTVWALPAQARLILLGDKDQLSSVEAGAVLGDICGQAGKGYSPAFRARLAALTGEAVADVGAASSPLQDGVALLRHSFRFGGDSGIGRLARAINEGQPRAIQAVLRDPTIGDIRWHTPARPVAGADTGVRPYDGASGVGRAENEIMAMTGAGYAPYLRAVRDGQPVAAVFAAFGHFQVLCAQRGGTLGVERLNALFEARVRRDGREWYPGRPVMITRNDYHLKLFNGDIGITLADGDDARLRVFFQGADGSFRSLPVSRVPAHETVFAMTIHKSQGSEFDRVLLILPEEKSRLLTRELIYTGITRARHAVEVWGDPAMLQTAARQSLSRASGLGERLHPAPAAQADASSAEGQGSFLDTSQ